jgi:hypothetical protein
MNDVLKSFVPFYFREIQFEGTAFLELQVFLTIVSSRSTERSVTGISSFFCATII